MCIGLITKRNKKRLIQYVERDNTHLLTMNFVIFILDNNATLYEVYHEVKNVNKGVGLVGDNGIVLVIRSSNSKNTLEEFHEFFGNFKPNNSTARVEVIDQSVLEPFWRF